VLVHLSEIEVHSMPVITLQWPTLEGVEFDSQTLALGSYRHDIAYTGALKSCQALALGSYRHDIAYTGALKSCPCQVLALGSYRNDIAYTGALKSIFTGKANQGTGNQGQSTEWDQSEGTGS
jgi:hypothetical protein